MSAKPVAWLGTFHDEEDGDICDVAFAATRGAARVRLAWELDADGFADSRLTVRRAPAFDPYAEQGHVPPKAFWASGFSIECDGCGAYMAQDDGVPVFAGNRVYHAACAPGVGERQQTNEEVHR